jgi:hypothetical protein
VATSNFWRQYLWLLEKQLGINFDRAQFEFYEKGVAETPAGIIVLADANKKPMYQTFPWRLSLMPSVNILIGLVIPWAVTIFWLLLLVGLLYNDHSRWLGIVVLVAFTVLFLSSRLWGAPTQPKGQEALDQETQKE